MAMESFRNDGVRSSTVVMPAQWESHAGTLLAYPFGDELWFGRLDAVRKEYDALILAISKKEDVLLVVPPNSNRDLEGRPWHGLSHVHRLEIPLDDIWVRDSGPIFVQTYDGHGVSLGLEAFDFQFNAWGKKFHFAQDALLGQKVAQALNLHRRPFEFVFEGGSLDVNGQGLALTTEQCLLEPSRNPGWTKGEIEKLLKEAFSLDSLLWLERGLIGDHTDGHIDTIARFVSSSTVVALVAEDRSHPSFEILNQNIRFLERLAALPGSGLKEVIPLPIARGLEHVDGELVPFTYANFYFSNSGLLVPLFDDENDQRALDILSNVVKDRPVIGLSCREIVRGGGVINCLTQQIPACPGLELWSAWAAGENGLKANRGESR